MESLPQKLRPRPDHSRLRPDHSRPRPPLPRPRPLKSKTQKTETQDRAFFGSIFLFFHASIFIFCFFADLMVSRARPIPLNLETSTRPRPLNLETSTRPRPLRYETDVRSRPIKSGLETSITASHYTLFITKLAGPFTLPIYLPAKQFIWPPRAHLLLRGTSYVCANCLRSWLSMTHIYTDTPEITFCMWITRASYNLVCIFGTKVNKLQIC